MENLTLKIAHSGDYSRKPVNGSWNGRFLQDHSSARRKSRHEVCEVRLERGKIIPSPFMWEG